MSVSTRQMVEKVMELVSLGKTLPNATTGATDQQVLDDLHEAEQMVIDEVPRFARKTATFSTASGTYVYDEMDDLNDYRIHHMEVAFTTTQNGKLTQRDYDWLKRNKDSFESTTVTGRPTYYCVEPINRSIVLWPTPNATYTVTAHYDYDIETFAYPEIPNLLLDEHSLDGSPLITFDRTGILDRRRNLAFTPSWRAESTWDASTNTPTLTDAGGTEDDYYVVSVGAVVNTGTLFGGDSTTLTAGDLIKHDGTEWQQISGGALVSVYGYTDEGVLDGPNSTILTSTTAAPTTDGTDTYREITQINLPEVNGETINVGCGNTFYTADGKTYRTTSALTDKWAMKLAPYYAAARYRGRTGDTESEQMDDMKFQSALHEVDMRMAKRPNEKRRLRWRGGR